MASIELRAAAQQALEQVQEFKRRWWLVPAFGNKVNKATREAITNAHSPIFELEHALRAALEETVQEPFALPCPTPKACKAHCCSGHCVPRTNHLNHMTRIPPMLCITHRIPDCPKCMSTHTTPPQRKPLTEEEIQAAWDSVDMRHPRGAETRIAYARAIERAHGIGGEG